MCSLNLGINKADRDVPLMAEHSLPSSQHVGSDVPALTTAFCKMDGPSREQCKSVQGKYLECSLKMGIFNRKATVGSALGPVTPHHGFLTRLAV